MTAVKVTGISEQVTDQQLRDFLSYCGEIASLSRAPLSATVTFNCVEAAETAELLSGAVLGGSQVIICRDAGLAPTSIDSASALAFVESMVSKGIVVGEEAICALRARAAALKGSGVGLTVHHGAKRLVDAGRTAVSTVAGTATRGQPTTEQWMYGSQPQWGPPPKS